MEAKKFDPATALNYESSKNEAEHGHKYQRELAFMLFVRVALKGYKFKLFTELPEAGKFDDVAMYVEDFNVTWLFQSKHADPTQEGKILTKVLVPTDARLLGKDFDLFKYARSRIAVAQKIKGNKRYFLFTNKSLDEESIRNSGYLEIFPGKVDETVDLSSLGGEYKTFKLSKTDNELIRSANKEFYDIVDAIANLISPKTTEGDEKKRNALLTNYKAVVCKILVRDDEKNNESPAMKKMIEEIRCLLGKDLDALECLIDLSLSKRFSALGITLKCDNGRSFLDANKSKYTEPPDFVGETELKEFFENFTMCVSQPNVLETAAKNEIGLWLRKNIPPNSLGQFTSSQLDQPMFKFYQTFKEWYEPDLEKKPTRTMDSLGSEKAEKCKEAILKDFELHMLQPDVLERYYVPREIDCGNSLRVSEKAFPEWLTKEFNSNNCLVLIAGPGMGKTTFMQYVSFAMQRVYHSTNFYMIYLKDLTENLQKMRNDQINLEQVFKGSLSEQSCTMIRAHTQNTESRIMFFLDGFDEVPSAENSKMIAILKQLLSMERVQLMISGRKHVQQQLQQLSHTIRYVNLVPFANKDQLDFLQKFWDVSKEDETTMAKFCKFANQLLQTFHRGIKRSQYDFTGVPLMVRMLAEVNVENVEKCLLTDCETDGENYLPTTGFNEVTLYEQFVKKSFCMKMRKKFNLDAYITKQSVDGELKALFDQNTLEYQLAAINELNIKELDKVVCEEHGKTYEEFLNRVGNGDDKSLLINTSGKTVRFVHLSFAEYFTAKCLCDYIERCKHILYPILEKQLVVRKFFFQLIEEISGETHTKCLGVLNKICELTPSVAFWACEAVCVNVTKCLLKHNALQNIRIDDYGTILHLAVSIDSREIVEYLLEDYGMDSNIVSNTEINPLADFVRNKQEFPEHMSIDENITPLIWAVYHGHANIVSLLLNHNADVNAKSNSKLTALHLAAQYGFLEIADVLLQTNKCNGNAQDEYGRTALHFAVNFNHIQIVRLLMNHSADLKLDLNAVDSSENTALHLAVLRNHTELAKLLIGNPSVDINARNEDSIVPLHLAAEHGNSVIVELLVTHRASIDVLNSKKCTPLDKAAEKGHTDIVKILIANGANIKYTGKDTPLALAASSGNLETFESLLVLVSAAEEDNAQIQQDVLWKAVGLDRVEIVRKLLDGYSVDVNDATGWGSTPLHDSASRGYTDVVRTLLDHGAVIDSRDSDNMTPLMKACNAGHEAIVKILLEKSANPNAQAFCQFTALHYATYSGHLGVVKLLLDGGAEVNAIDDKQRTPLHLAATGSHEEIVKLLLLRSANQNLQDSNQDTPLHLAIRSQYTECSEMLINERTDFNLQNKKRWTPLHVAIHYERNKIVPQLILPENLNLPDIEGRTPLHLAVDKKSVENVKVLLNFSSDVKLNAQDNKQQTPLHLAAQHGHSEIVRQLLAVSTRSIDVQDNKQQTPLHLAAQHGHSEIVRQLLAVSTTIIDALDKDHNTALHLALQHVNGETAHLLIERSSKLEATNRKSQTPLHLASQAGLDTAVHALIQKGVHVNPRDKMQRTPLHMAALRGHVDVVQVLIDNSAQVDVTDTNGRTPLGLAIEDDIVTMLQNYMQ